jgi:hypothetical protein
MVGIFLKERELQYTANKDETTNTWRILDTWHNDLVNLGPDDEIPDGSPAVTILTEGAFIALVKEAARQGILQNANLGGGDGGDSDEELMEKDEEIADLKALLGKQGKQIETKTPKRTEGYMLKEMAMTNILKIVSIADIESLTEE